MPEKPSKCVTSGDIRPPSEGPPPSSGADLPPRELPPAARRALAEAEARRRETAERQSLEKNAIKEIGGRSGPDPVRYGDWEVKGIASDF
jgi:hypothetical protein